jgi:polyisoprenoid-binding protein YceI
MYRTEDLTFICSGNISNIKERLAMESRNQSIARSFILVVSTILLLVAGCNRTSTPEGSPRGSALPPPGIYALDPPHTFAYFAAQHLVVGMVRGRFDKISGTISVTEDLAKCTVDVFIETASISTQNNTRDEDLRGPDFFDANKFPVIEFHGQGIRRVGDGWVVNGSLIIHGISKIVPLEFVFKGIAPALKDKPNRVAFHASTSAKRADFGMNRELLDEIGKLSDSPDVWIDIDAELLASEPATR